ncbi:MAG: hypothetical protein A2309_03320 [Bacteroidetes bacterium RIFOXYB2_FULL_35_7]|nr:MAG: hypothetical protein A2X01_14715 [Bacteroidetes bacterium GWF2_35_48]OFY97665.1 MAG: hypothetical protein A2309_03320 [Bacteroidetes bacterium RIFOXYB2_FULL_35_7]OFZ01036.1 MAG: hypothetical protein A2491_17620 [Bacteroidetes bacterium RIFOXYC12_FULL_35_7]HBX53562.1 hypothetical protein [Bacteroidales bacterium]
MVHPFLNFILGTAATAGAAFGLDSIDSGSFGSLDELIKYIISIVGGLLATLIINLLKKKFPEWFSKQKNISQ